MAGARASAARAGHSLCPMRTSVRKIASAARAGARRLLDGERGDPETPLRTMHRDGPFDPWLSLFDDELSELDAACRSEGLAALPRFRDLDDDLWTILLSRSYEGYPGI